MKDRIRPFFVWAIKMILFATAFMPLVVASKSFFPFIVGKMLFFRGVVEAALFISFLYFAYAIFLAKETRYGAIFPGLVQLRKVALHPIIIALGFFVLSLIASTVFAESSYRAFWGDLERAEGLYGMLHFFVFFVLAAAFFERKDWITYFRVSLIAGFVLIWYAFLQYFGVQQFPFARPPSSRPDSLVGNPAFLGTHMLFLALFALIVMRSAASAFWRNVGIAALILSFLGIFITNTRGVLLGLVAGLFFLLCYFALKKREPIVFRGRNINIRLLASILLFVLMIFGVVFFLTRGSDVWQNIPGLDRLARTSFFDPNDPSTQTRVITWKVSWEAFKDRPIFGWGPENYLAAYEAHYDPDYAIYGETWLDRAHNKLFDVLVMQGSFGIISYLLLWWAVIFTLFRLGIEGSDLLMKLRPFFAAALLAYFVQNLVLFDQIVSYAAFFAVLGFLVAFSLPERTGASSGEGSGVFYSKIAGALALPAAAAIVYLFYAFSYVPYVQAKAMKDSPGSGSIDGTIEQLKKAMYPYNFAQYTIRGQGLDLIYRDQFFFNDAYRTDLQLSELKELWLRALEEFVARESYDARVLIRAVEVYDVLGRDNPEYWKRAEDILRAALLRAPERQELYYHLALNLMKQDRVAEALEYAKKAVDLSPGVARAHFHYAVILTAAQKGEEAQTELARAEELKPSFDGFFPTDFNTILLLYAAWGRRDKIADLVVRHATKEIALPPERRYVEMALYYFLIERDMEKFIKVAEYLRDNTELADDMIVLIDLARNGKWNIIENLMVQ